MPVPADTAAPILSRPNWLLLGLIFAIGAAYQLVHPIVADVAWLIDVNEKMLAGRTLYVDMIETNPPMAVFLYTPAVVLQSLIGVPAGIVQVFLTLALIAGSLTLTTRIMAVSGRACEIPRFLMVAAFVLVVLPAYAFSEREHLAIALMLPALAIVVARAGGHDIGRVLRVIAGIGVGIAVSVKPHFAAGLLLPVSYLAIRQRSVRPLVVLENWIAAAIVLAHLAIIPVVFPAYFSVVVPMLLETYRQLRFSPLDLMTDPQVLVTAGTGIATIIIVGRDALVPRVLVSHLAAIGFLISFLEQGKGWIYQLYPALALIFLVFLTETLPRSVGVLTGPDRFTARSAIAGMLSIGFMLGLARTVTVLQDRNWGVLQLVEPIRRTFDHPKLLALSSSLSIGFPITRMVDGQWVGTFGQQMVTQSATLLSDMPGASAETRARLGKWLDRDRAYLAHDLKVGRPDLVLVDRDRYPWDALMASGTEAADLLGHYQRIATIDDIDLLVPRDRVAATVAIGALAR